MKRFSCRDVIPGCDRVFTGVDDDSLLEQVMAHAAVDHGLIQPPPALAELVAATTYSVPTSRSRSHLRLVGGHDDASREAPSEPQMEHPAAAAHHSGDHRNAAVLTFPPRRPTDAAAAAPAAHRHAGTVQHETVQHDSYRHECFLYHGTEEFVAALVPFIRDGLALGQPVMVAVIEPRASALRAALGDDADAVVFVDMAVLGANPARIIPAWRAFTDTAAGRPTRGIGEPIWAGRRPAEIAEGQFHEALLNLSSDDGTPLWLVCPYDADALDDSIIEEARRSHPFHTGTPAGAEYAGQGHALEFFAAPLPEPAGRVCELDGESAGVDIAAQLLWQAGAAGLPSMTSARLAAAVDAVTSSATGHVSVRLWQEQGTLVCQIDDTVGLVDPLVGRASALPVRGPERGIRLANELCDLVQVRSGAAGTSVRLHSWL